MLLEVDRSTRLLRFVALVHSRSFRSLDFFVASLVFMKSILFCFSLIFYIFYEAIIPLALVRDEYSQLGVACVAGTRREGKGEESRNVEAPR